MEDLLVVGIGPGNAGGMTIDARAAILEADVIAGYKTYIDILKNAESALLSTKEIISTGMTQEEERVILALKSAAAGKKTALACSGDAGVYALSSLALSLAPRFGVGVEIVPGVTVALSGAALLGSPLTNDFAVVSLSDRLTPWEKIEKRLRATSLGDFCVVLYNPRSKTRTDTLFRAAKILLENRAEHTVCGFVKNVGRNAEEWGILTLLELCDFEADMFSTIFVGNSDTKIIQVGNKKRMVTERGYGVSA